VPLARSIFDEGMTGPNQIDRARDQPPVRAAELLRFARGPVTQEGVRRNVRVSVRYLEAWFRGIGCVPIDHLMEDAATVEIARCQLWQWIHYGAVTDGGTKVGQALFRSLLAGEVESLRADLGSLRGTPTLGRAAQLLDRVVTEGELEEFITVKAYLELEDPPGSAP
jgi:malate synthase